MRIRRGKGWGTTRERERKGKENKGGKRDEWKKIGREKRGRNGREGGREGRRGRERARERSEGEGEVKRGG